MKKSLEVNVLSSKGTSRLYKSYLLALALVIIVAAAPMVSAYTFSRFPWYSWIPAENPAPSTPTNPTNPTNPPKDQTPSTPPTNTTLTPIKMSATEKSSLELINSDRAKVGASPLKEDQYLNALARKRAEHMLKTGTISHVIPDLGSPWTSLTTYKISYKNASENLQYGARSVVEAHMYLMNSHSHKTNILRKDFNSVGIAVIPNGKGGYLQVQLFAER